MYLTRQQSRDIDQCAIANFGIASAVLMENAGRGAAELLISLGVRARVVVCCGKGNNGGDGLVIARHLQLAGVEVETLLFCRPEELTGDAAANYRAVVQSKLPLRVILDDAAIAALPKLFTRVEWIVDALFGTGFKGVVRSPFDLAIAAINRSSACVLAVDLPSGLDCDTGMISGAAVRAHHTATFVAEKMGFRTQQAADYLGIIHVRDVGIPVRLIEEVIQV